jgi:penicillin-binding protein 1A
MLVGIGTFIGGLLAAPIDFALAAPPSTAILLAADGRQLATIEPPERRENVKASDIPEVMRQAIISAEDERFLKHQGVDPLATVRAAFRDLTGGNTQGGSTLTQQYVKNAYVGNERTAMRKIREAALAYRLEQKLSKQEILTDYLNALYLGNGLYGVQAASKYYFGVPVKDLDLNEATGQRDPLLALARASLMAGIAPAPSAWNPVKDFTTARVRQRYTLNRMVINGYITARDATEAYRAHYDKRSSILRETPPKPKNDAPEFTDYVTYKVQHAPDYDEDAFFRGGLRVKTTLDLDLQQAFQAALKEVLPDATDPQAALVAVDYRNGDIKAMATLRRVPALKQGGKVINTPVSSYQVNGFNLATNALRSTGSTIKTFTLAQALAEGHSLSETRYGSARDTVKCPSAKGGVYSYGNSGDGEAGRFSLESALAHSVNTIYVPLALEVGRDDVARLAERAGLAPRPPNRQSLEGPKNAPANFCSFGIGGGVDVTPLAEAVAYGTFANDGVHVSPRSFTEVRTGASGTSQGEVLFKQPVAGLSRVVQPKVAKDVVKALTSVVEYGTATSAKQPYPVFGKTGTTNDSTDAWFTGCMPTLHLCMASWMGYEYINCNPSKGAHVDGPCGGMKDVHGVKQVFGGTLPAKVFTRAQELYRVIKADRAARAAGIEPTVSPSPTRRPRTATSSPTPAVLPSRTAGPKPTKPVVTQSPKPVQTTKPPILLPPNPTPSPSASPP